LRGEGKSGGKRGVRDIWPEKQYVHRGGGKRSLEKTIPGASVDKNKASKSREEKEEERS